VYVCFLFFTRAHSVIGLWAVELASKLIRIELVVVVVVMVAVAAAAAAAVVVAVVAIVAIVVVVEVVAEVAIVVVAVLFPLFPETRLHYIICCLIIIKSNKFKIILIVFSVYEIHLQSQVFQMVSLYCS
jgi:hypothetical protein